MNIPPQAASTDAVTVTRDGVIATVTLNRPEHLNALDRSMRVGLTRAMRSLSSDDDLRCVVLRGAGDKAFAAGADIAEFANERSDSRQAAAYGASIHEAMQAIGNSKHPSLVSRVVQDDEVEDEVQATAGRIAAGAPLVARWHKQFIERLAIFAELSPEEWKKGFACYDTQDYREGVDAFLAKRKPQFKGR
jgi:enoyl-CoA hydratase/carnithine racemase